MPAGLRTARRRRLTTLTSAAAALVLAACSSSGSSHPAAAVASGATTSAPAVAATSAPAVAATSPAASSSAPAPPSPPTGQLYLSVGDSYAAGYQPTSARQGHTTTNGFAYQLVGLARAKGYDLRLVNVGCSGATTGSALHRVACDHDSLGPGATPYDGRTQAAAAEAVLRSHRGGVGLVTVSLGGNDVTQCALDADPAACVVKAVPTVTANLTTLLRGLRAAAGPGVPIVGITYPDVILAGYLSSAAGARSLATVSVVAFKSLINPALASVYAGVGARFVDVTAATGAYGPLTATTLLAPYGRIPTPVAQVCRLTYACQYPDIHPRTPGYALIARLVAATLPARNG